jgi:hypothetical protein
MWPDHLNTTYNRGTYQVHNYACSQATTSRSIVEPTDPTLADGSIVLTQEDQLSRFFTANPLTGTATGIPWKSNSSLFFFSGTTTGNDVLNSANDYPYDTNLLPSLINKWRELANSVRVPSTIQNISGLISCIYLVISLWGKKLCLASGSSC